MVILNCLSIGTFIVLRCPTGMDCELHRSKWWKPACALCVQEEEKEEEVGRYKKHSIATNPVWRRNWVLRFDQHPNNRGAIYINMGSLKSSYPSKNANFTKSRYTNKSLNVLGIQTPSISLLMDWQISVESTRKFHVSHPLALIDNILRLGKSNGGNVASLQLTFHWLLTIDHHVRLCKMYLIWSCLISSQNH